MVATLVISIATCLSIVLVSLLKPSIKIKSFKINLYWIIALIGALLIILITDLSFNDVFQGLTKDGGINPIEILILFISMSVISITLDEVGFFQFLASRVITKCKRNQFIIFIAFYLLASILTMFTSNDIVILTLTPFIIFFAKNGKINPIPYLISEFIAANTWSMIFIIGNPTNIYLASSFDVSFIEYFKIMWLPTITSGLVEFILLLLIFNKQLKKPIEAVDIEIAKCDKVYTIVGLTILFICTVLLVISSYIEIKMYLISAISLLTLLCTFLLINIIKKEKPTYVINSLKRAPLEIVPFILGMFTIVLALDKQGITEEIANLLGNSNSCYVYGYTSLVSANLINNIPMSCLFSSIIDNYTGTNTLGAIYSSIIGSNIGAFITPFGALAGIMWMGILKNHNIKFNFLDFVKYGALVGIIVASVAFIMLNLSI